MNFNDRGILEGGLSDLLQWQLGDEYRTLVLYEILKQYHNPARHYRFLIATVRGYDTVEKRGSRNDVRDVFPVLQKERIETYETIYMIHWFRHTLFRIKKGGGDGIYSNSRIGQDLILPILLAYERRILDIKKYDLAVKDLRAVSRRSRGMFALSEEGALFRARDDELAPDAPEREAAVLDIVKSALVQSGEIPPRYRFDVAHVSANQLLEDLYRFGPPEFRLAGAPPVPNLVL